MKIWYIIPARAGSKGLPYKNRKLFEYTAKTIPKDAAGQVIVTSDDDHILSLGSHFGFTCIKRPDHLSCDNSSTRDVLQHTADQLNIPDGDLVVLLYLTYPSRRWSDVQRAVSFFLSNQAKSLLCRKPVKDSPYLMMFEEENITGSKVIDHDLCRRQDYRNTFVMSHFIGVFQVRELELLDTNLWNRATIFMPISEKIDVDSHTDLSKYLMEKKDEC